MSPPTLYSILLSTSGLSQRGAAALHGDSVDSVRSWCIGRRTAPESAYQRLAVLIRRQVEAAYEWAEAPDGSSATEPDIGCDLRGAKDRCMGIVAALLTV